jgi:eukaryotic-like serine/threonine-protein kinase
MTGSSNSSQYSERILRAACTQVESLANGGCDSPASSVLAEYQEFQGVEEAEIEIIYTEYIALDEVGRRPDPEAWLARFPKHRARLERLLKLHDFLSESDLDTNESGPISNTLSGSSNPALGDASKEKEKTPLGSFGNYELIDEIGRGGMGVVYRAKQRGLGREVAVKVLRSLDSKPNERARFQREAESIASLQHRYIVQVFETGEHLDMAYLAMEYVPGGSLEQTIRKKKWSNHEIASLVKMLADAMHYAHQKGIIHRDLKPANILLTNDGEPKIADFGLAKRTDESTNFKTNTGTLLGTPCYMSPEQASGQTDLIGATTDVYAIGVILYELLTRRLPFEGESSVDTLQMIVQRDAVLPSKLVRHVSRDLETICLKCLSKTPSSRYSTAALLSEDLERFLDHRPVLARRISWTEKAVQRIRRHPQVAALLLALSVVCLGGVGLFLWQQRRVELLHQQATRRAWSESQQRSRAVEAEAAYETSLRKARELVGQWTQLGLKLDNEPGMDDVRRKAFEDAVAYYEEFLARNTSDPAIKLEASQASMRAAIIHTELGLWSKAEAGLKRTDIWYSELPNDSKVQWLRTDCLIQLGHAQRRLERWQESETTYLSAIQLLDELLKQSPTNTDYLLRLANAQVNMAVVYRAQQRWEDALSIYIEAFTNGLTATTIRAGIQKTIPSQDPSSKELPLQFAEKVKLSQAVRETLIQQDSNKLKAIASQNYLTEMALCLDDLGLLLRQQYLNESAELCIRESIELRKLSFDQAPQNRRVEQYLARSQTHLGALLTESGRYDEAHEMLSEADRRLSRMCKDFPNRHDYRSECAQNLVSLAKCQHAQGNFQEAANSSKRSIAIQEQLVASMPDIEYLKTGLTSGLIMLGQSLKSLNDRENAAVHFERSIAIDPNSSSTLNTYAWMLVCDTNSSEKDIEKSVDLAAKAVKISPNNASIWNTYSLSLYRAQRYADCMQAIDRTMELAVGGTTLDWFIKSMASSRLGNQDEARSWFARAEARRTAQSPENIELRRFSLEARDLLVEKTN